MNTVILSFHYENVLQRRAHIAETLLGRKHIVQEWKWTGPKCFHSKSSSSKSLLCTEIRPQNNHQAEDLTKCLAFITWSCDMQPLLSSYRAELSSLSASCHWWCGYEFKGTLCRFWPRVAPWSYFSMSGSSLCWSWTPKTWIDVKILWLCKCFMGNKKQWTCLLELEDAYNVFWRNVNVTIAYFQENSFTSV